jgi:hypothetical protein
MGIKGTQPRKKLSGIVFSYTVHVMWKEIFYIIQAKPFTKDFVNWCLSYTLAQPVDIDICIVMVLLLQYFGLNQFMVLAEKAKARLMQYLGMDVEKKSYEMELNS